MDEAIQTRMYMDNLRNFLVTAELVTDISFTAFDNQEVVIEKGTTIHVDISEQIGMFEYFSFDLEQNEYIIYYT